MELVHENVRNKIYSSNTEDVMLCLNCALRTATLRMIPGLFSTIYKINQGNLIYTTLRENGITREIKKIDYGNAELITFYKNGKKILESKFIFHYIGNIGEGC